MPGYAAGRSHPTRGEWIEISQRSAAATTAGSHPTRGEWIEIRAHRSPGQIHGSLTPHGVSGLK